MLFEDLTEVKMWIELIMMGLALGASLAMDAFSVSLANGLNEPKMKKRKLISIAGIFAFFQFVMPMLGWLFVSLFVEQFKEFENFIPWIALGLLGFIGGKMLYEGIRNKEEECEKCAVGFWGLVLQGIATSINALSSGFAIEVSLILGRTVGTKLAGKASILGGSILVIIGIVIFVKGVFF